MAATGHPGARRGLPPTPAASPRDGLLFALLHTIPGRAIVVGAAIKVFDAAVASALGGWPAVLGVIDTTAGIAIAAGAVWFLVRLMVAAKRRLLWRVRRKLMLSYVFIGFVPALLIVAFFRRGVVPTLADAWARRRGRSG